MEKKYMRYLITYDIRDEKRLTKVAKIMKDFGERVQYSVFECNLQESELNMLKSRLKWVINMEQDSVIFYYLCESCFSKIQQFGEGRNYEDDYCIVI